MSLPGDNLNGWAAVGYGAAGGYRRDAEQRAALQKSAMALQDAQTSNYNSSANLTNEKVAALQAQNQQLAFQNTITNNYIAAQNLDGATNNLIKDGDYEGFNQTINSNPTLKNKMQEMYGVKGIRPIDWNNTADVKQVEEGLGLDPKTLNSLRPQDLEALQKSYYMTDAGHLASVGDFAADTGYLDRATSNQYNNFIKTQDELANIGKHLSTDQVQAKSAHDWLETNPDKTYNDWLKTQVDNKADAQIKVNASKPTKATHLTKSDIVSWVANYDAEITKGYKPTPAEQAEHDVYKNAIDTDTEQKIASLKKHADMVAKYMTNIGKPDFKISNTDIADMNAYEQSVGHKPNPTTAREYTDDIVTAKAGVNLAKDIDSLGDEQINQGAYDEVKQWATKKLSDTAFNTLSPEAKEKALLTVATKSKVGAYLAAYVKSISGTAVAESEYDRLKEVLTSGNYNNIESFKDAINSFVGVNLTNDRNKFKSGFLAEKSLSLNAMKQLDEAVKGFHPAAIGQQTEQQPTVTKFEPGKIYQKADGTTIQISADGKSYKVIKQ